MATATYVKVSEIAGRPDVKSTAIVNVNGTEVQVEFWYEVIEQYGKEGTKQFLCAEALKQTGNLADAHELLKADATGKLVLNADKSIKSDDRSWQQKWKDDYTLPVANIVPEVDPLL
jgi:hypothetical protein